jgi:hypothetical protein
MSDYGQERRVHKRQNLACPISFLSRGGHAVAVGKTINISDGGALISLPACAIPDIGANVNVKFAVPRNTPNTYMLEKFASQACVTRRHALLKDSSAGVAVRFGRPLDLALEV